MNARDPRWWILLPALLLAGALACMDLTPDPPGAAAVTSERGQLQLRVGQARVVVPPGTFPAGTEVSVRPHARPPAGIDAAELASEVFEIEAGGAQPGSPVTLTLPVDASRLPGDAEPVVARWDGAAWVALPTEPWEGGATLTARTDHFSFFAVLRGTLRKVVRAVDNSGLTGSLERYNQGELTVFSHELVTPGGFRIQYDREGARAPLPGPGDDSAHLGYVKRLGDVLDHALDRYQRDPRFGGAELDPQDLPIFQVRPLTDTAEEQVMGSTPGTGGVTFIHHRLPEHVLQQTGAHELFHHVLIRRVGPDVMAAHRWWVEAITEWAGSQVVPHHYARSSLVDVGRAHPEPVSIGFGPHLDVTNQYMAGDLVRYLEDPAVCPGISLAAMEGLRTRPADDWGRVLSELAPRHCVGGRSFEDTFEGYALAYYIDQDDDIGGSPPRLGKDAVSHAVSGDRDRYVALAATLRPTSARQLAFRVAGDLEGRLVLRTDGGGSWARYRVNRLLPDGTLAGLDAEVPRGARMKNSSPPRVIEGFGAGSDTASLLVTAVNPNPIVSEEVGIEAWLLEAIEGVSAQPPIAEGARTRVQWKPLRLRSTHRGGPLESYRVYQRTPTGDVLLQSVAALRTEALVDTVEVEGPVLLLVRGRDRFGNETPDHVPASLPGKDAVQDTIDRGLLGAPPPGAGGGYGGCGDVYGLTPCD